MVHVGGEEGPRRYRRPEQHILKWLERAPVDQLLSAAGERITAAVELPVHAGYVLAHGLDLRWVTTAQAALVGKPYESNGHGVEAHHLRGHGVDGHLVGAGEKHVLLVPLHGPRAGTVTRKRAVHYGEDAGVNLLLDCQKVHQRLVDHGVRPVALAVQQAAKGVLHCAGHGREDVGLHGGQVYHVLARENLGDSEALREDLVQHHHLCLGLEGNPPVRRHVQVYVGQVVLILNRLLLVANLAFERVDDDGSVVCGDEVLVAVFQQRLDDSFELPRRG